MGIVGTYLMMFAQHRGIAGLELVGVILATIGFCVAVHFEEKLEYRIRRLERSTK